MQSPNDWPQGGKPLHPPAELLPPGGGPVDAAHRVTILDWAVAHCTATGWRVESRSGSQAVLARTQKVKHAGHALLMFLTCFLWLPEWILIGLSKKKSERVTLAVDELGRVLPVAYIGDAPGHPWRVQSGGSAQRRSPCP